MPNVGRPIDEAAREARATKIVEAAVACFVQKGFHGTSMSHISKQAKVSQANVYQYFDSKNDLIIDIARRAFERDLATVQKLERSQDLLGDIIKLALKEDKRLGENPTDAIMYQEILAEASRNADVQRIVVKAEKELMLAFTQVIKCAKERGVIQSNLAGEHIASFIFNYLNGAIGRVAALGDTFPFKDFEVLLKTLFK